MTIMTFLGSMLIFASFPEGESDALIALTRWNFSLCLFACACVNGLLQFRFCAYSIKQEHG